MIQSLRRVWKELSIHYVPCQVSHRASTRDRAKRQLVLAK